MKREEVKKTTTINDFLKTAADILYEAYYSDKKGYHEKAVEEMRKYNSFRDSIVWTLYSQLIVKTWNEAVKFTDSEIQKEFLNLEKKRGFVVEVERKI